MITISPESIQAIHAHGESTYPEECCGMLLGQKGEGTDVVKDIVHITNAQEANRQRRFRISPEQYRDAERTAAGRQMTLLGFYHSHPDHPAIPSEYDTEHALPWFAYLIVAVSKRRAGDLTAWVLTENRERFERQAVEVSGLKNIVTNMNR